MQINAIKLCDSNVLQRVQIKTEPGRKARLMTLLSLVQYM